MAYVPTFSRIDDELEKQSQGGEASPSGDAPPSASGGGGPGVAAPSYTQSNFASGKKILNANQNAELGLDVTAPYKEQVSKASEGENSAWNTYGSGNAAAKSAATVNDEDVKSYAETGDEGAKSRVSTALSAAYKPTAYTPYGSSVSMADVGRLGTSAGLQAALSDAQQRKGTYDYGSGQSALDSLIYNRRPETRDQISSLGRDVGQFNQLLKSHQDQFQRDQGIDPTTGKAVENSGIAAEIKAQQEAARGRIQALAGDIKNQPMAGGDVGRMKVESRDAATAQNADLIKKMLNERATGIKDEDIRSAYLDQIKNYDNSKLFPVLNQQFTDPSVAYSQDQADRFNRLQGLLGGSESLSPTTAGNLGYGVSSENVGKLSENLQKEAQSKVNAKRQSESIAASKKAEADAAERAIQNKVADYASSRIRPQDAEALSKMSPSSIYYKPLKEKIDAAKADIANYEKKLRGKK